MQKQCTVDLWTAGYAGSRLTASARSPMDKPWTTLCVAHRLPTGRRLPTSSTVLKPIVIKSGKVKTKTPAPALAYSSPVAVQTTGTTADNAPTESWFNSFKNERVHGIRYATHADMKAASFEYIEVFYNRKRQHSTLGYKSPIQFLESWISEQHQEKLVA